MTPCAEVSVGARWVLLAVRPRTERKVQAALAQVGIESFVPWRAVRRRWSDRIKVLRQNLLPGYVFCRATFAERMLLMTQPGVKCVVSSGVAPVNIPDSEMIALCRVVSSNLPVLSRPFLATGPLVRVERGPLAGIEGVLAQDYDACRVVLNIDALRRSIAVEVDRYMICPTQEGPSNAAAVGTDIFHWTVSKWP